MVSFRALSQAQPDLVAQTATYWDTFGSRLDAQHQELTEVITTIDTGWDGDARDAALAYLVRIADRLDRGIGLVPQISPLLDQHATDVGVAQRLPRGAVAAAEAAGLSVGPDGSLGLPSGVGVLLALTDPPLLVLQAPATRIPARIRPRQQR